MEITHESQIKALLKANDLIDLFTFKCNECDYEDNARVSAIIHVKELLDVIEDEREVFNWKTFYNEVLLCLENDISPACELCNTEEYPCQGKKHKCHEFNIYPEYSYVKKI